MVFRGTSQRSCISLYRLAQISEITSKAFICQQLRRKQRLYLPTTRTSGSRETNASQHNVTYDRAQSLRHHTFHLLLNLLLRIIRAGPHSTASPPRRLAPLVPTCTPIIHRNETRYAPSVAMLTSPFCLKIKPVMTSNRD